MVCGVGSGQTSWCIACRTQVRSEELRKKKKSIDGEVRGTHPEGRHGKSG